MTLSLFVQSVVVGLSLAAMYTLMALGLTLIFGILGIVNMTHGVFFMLGAYALYYFYSIFGLNFYVAMLAMMITVGVVGLITERLFLRPLGGFFAPVVVMTVGLLMLFETVGTVVFGVTARGLTPPVTGVSQVLGVGISNYQLVLIGATVVLVSALYYLIYKTRVGLHIRAVEEDPVAARLQGINVNRINAYVFGAGVILAGVAGAITSPLYWILPTMGGTPLVKAFIVITLGGMGSIPGAILGAVVLGLADSILAVTVGAEMAYIITWLVVILVLIFRPKGLMGAAHG